MKIRKALFWAHLAAGLAAGVVILSMAVTGILMAYEPQLTAWAEQDRRKVAVPEGAVRRPLDRLLEKAVEETRKGRPSNMTIGSDPSASVAVSFGKAGGNLYLDPYTGSVLGGDSRLHAFLRGVEQWHRWFAVRDFGKPVTGAANLGFLFLVVSGLYLWFPRRPSRAAFKAVAVPGLKLKGRARDWNWHNAAGFWASALVLTTTLTGAIVSYRWASDLVHVLTGNEPPPRPKEEGARAGAGKDKQERGREGRRAEAAPMASLDTVFAKAASKVPGWAAITLRLPQKPGGPLTAQIAMPGHAGKYARSLLTFDAATAEERKWEPFADQNLGRKLRAMVVPLHTGRVAGPLGQTLALLSAAAALLLTWTGFAMAWRRFTNPKPPRPEHAPDFAHGLWVEPGPGGYRIFFGEAEHNLREKKDKLGRFASIKTWEADGSEGRVQVKEDHLFAAAGAGGLLAAHLDSPVREPKEGMGGPAGGPVKSFQYLRFAEGLEAPGKAAAPLFLDILPEGKGNLTFTVTKGGHPHPEARVEVLAPNGWNRTFESGKDGKVAIEAPWPGLYIVKTAWKDKTPGEFEGKKYGTASHTTTLSFVRP